VPGITNAIKIVAADYRACALLSDGNVTCWGWSIVGPPPSLLPVQVAGLANVADLALSGYGAVARLSSGSLVGWGATFMGPNGGSYVEPPYPIAFTEVPQGLAIGPGTGFLVGATGL